MRRIHAALFVSAMLIGVVPSTAQAATITLSGKFDDPSNPALVASDLTAALFVSDNDIANNVALYDLIVPVAGNVTFESFGYAAGGAQPYFSLFAGSGDGATFVDSNYLIPDIDFLMNVPLAAGAYRIAVGVWENLSYAENYLGIDPTLTLSDGFLGLGGPDPFFLGDSYYEIRVTTPAAVPEPATLWLTGAGLAALSGGWIAPAVFGRGRQHRRRRSS
jgi:hypothetical protein